MDFDFDFEINSEKDMALPIQVHSNWLEYQGLRKQGGRGGN